MAVPKRKTSRSRRDKRRAQHGISVPRVQVCPTCKQPKRPHRVCPNCKTYKGRDVEPLRLEVSVDTPRMIRVAVDALGGDRAPDEVVAGAVAAASAEIQPVLCGLPALDAHGLPLVETRRASSRWTSRPVEAVRAKPDSSLVAAVRAVADGEADAVVSAGNTGAMLAASLLHIRRLPGVHRPAIAVVIPARSGPERADRRRRERRRAPRAPPPVRAHGRRLRARRSSASRSRRSGCSRSARRTRRAISSRSRRTSCSREHAALRRQHGEPAAARRRHRRGRHRRLHGQRRAEDARGDDQEPARGRYAASSSSSRARQARWAAHPAGRAARAQRLDPETYGGAYLLGLRGLVVIAHGSSSRVAIANAIRLAARGVEHDVVERLESACRRAC